MKILNILAVLSIFVAVFVYGQSDSKLQKKVIRVMEDTKSAGTKDEPVSQTTKDFIDSAINAHLNMAIEKKQDKEDFNIDYSTNCKDWLNLKTQKDAKFGEIVYYKRNGEISSIAEKKQQSVLYSNGKFVTIKITEGAIAGFHDKSPIYRGINNEKIHADLPGMLQALALVAANATSEWQVSFKKKNAVLLKVIQDKKDDLLKDYGFLGCVKEICFVTKNSKSEILTADSPIYKKLKSLNVFSREQMSKFYKMCDLINTNTFLADNENSMRTFVNACGLKVDPYYYGEISKTVSEGCTDLKNNLLPKVENFKGSSDY